MPMYRLAAAVAFASVLFAGTAEAQYQGIVSLPPVGPGDSRLLIGGAAISRPAYLGSDDRIWRVLPSIDYANRNGFFVGSGSGIGYSLISTRSTQFGIRLIPRFGRKESDSNDLQGMGDIGFGAEGSVFWTHAFSAEWTVGANLRGGSRGGEIDLGARRDFVLAPTTRMSVFGFATTANAKSNLSYYGVDAGQAAASGYPVFQPGAGLRNAQIGASFNHFFAGRWIAVGGLGIGRLLGDAADSPIVRERTHVTGFAAIGYQLF